MDGGSAGLTVKSEEKEHSAQSDADLKQQMQKRDGREHSNAWKLSYPNQLDRKIEKQDDATHPNQLAQPMQTLINQQGIAKLAFSVINESVGHNFGQTNQGNSG